jgi:Glycosyltransferase family 10 (fucosyltransferase) C-term
VEAQELPQHQVPSGDRVASYMTSPTVIGTGLLPTTLRRQTIRKNSMRGFSAYLLVLTGSYFILKWPSKTDDYHMFVPISSRVSETTAKLIPELRPLQKLNHLPKHIESFRNIKSYMLSENLEAIASSNISKRQLTLTHWTWGNDPLLELRYQEDIAGINITHDCMLSTCLETNDKSLPTDAYILNLRSGESLKPLPDNLTHQKIIFRMTESAAQRSTLNFTFDASVTYRSDSDGVFNYGLCQIRTEPVDHQDHSLGRISPAYWIISNWHGRRTQVYNELSELLEIDLFGGHTQNYISDWNSGDTVEMKELARKYWFYLAFENSECDQYISEKPWRALALGNVPVVLGGLSPPDYEDPLPPYSYIHIDDFYSVESLGKYLRFLMESPTEYNKYHKWRADYYIDYFLQGDPVDNRPYSHASYNSWCHTCDMLAYKLSADTFTQRTVNEWWFRESSCRV